MKRINPTSSFRFKCLLLLLILATLAAAKYFRMETWLRGALEWIANLGAWAPVIFILMYVLGAVLLVPASIFSLSAGALFGVVKGFLYVSVGATLGATAAFLVGRYFARDWVAKKISGNPVFMAIDQAVGEEGWKIVGLARLSPIFPFALLNYAFSLTRVSLRHYIVATWIGMMPAAGMYVYFGSLARAGNTPHERTAGEWILYGLGLLATVTATLLMTRIARNAIAKRITSASR